jgi:hypothetical protein
MSVFSRTANRINITFWAILEAVGFVFKMLGLLTLLAGFISISEQTLNFMRDDYWQSKSLFWAIPDSILTWIVTVGDLAGVSGQIVGLLTWIPLSLAALLTGVGLLLLGRLLARDS